MKGAAMQPCKRWSRVWGALGIALTLWVWVPHEVQAAPQPLTPRQIYKAYAQSVVLVFGTDGGNRGSAGTGSVISAEGEVLTNAHVVAKDGRPMRRLFVYLKPERLTGDQSEDLKRRYAATLVDMDADLDLALLKIVDPPNDLLPIDLADPAAVEIGEPVVAIGHPETGGLWTLTTGSVSSVVADFQGVRGKDVFQTEASVNRGNSGGPLLNAYGHMVGVNTSISRKSSDGLAITDINFSLKSSVAKRWLEKRRLMQVGYATPGKVAPKALARAGVSPTTTLAQADPKAGGEGPSGRARAEPELTAGGEADEGQTEVIRGTSVEQGRTSDGRTAYRVRTLDGRTLLVLMEPSDADFIPDDPAFARAAAKDAQLIASDGTSRRRDGPARLKGAPRVESKQLTRKRPYEMDAFIRERLEEIRELEDLMDDARRSIEEKSGVKSKKSKGLGLW